MTGQAAFLQDCDGRKSGFPDLVTRVCDPSPKKLKQKGYKFEASGPVLKNSTRQSKPNNTRMVFPYILDEQGETQTVAKSSC